MNAIQVALSIFIIIEVLNVITMYFFASSKRGNGMGVFKAYSLSKENESVHLLVKYLKNWVAGTKLIFIGLSFVILLYGNRTLHIASAIVMVVSILSFYFGLYPIIREMDKRHEIEPIGYSKVLALMIGAIILMFFITIFLV